EAEHAVGRLHAEPRGVLRLNVPMSFGQRHIGSALPGFLDAHPDISIHMELSDRFVDVIEEGYDLAIRIGALSDSSLIARRITALHRIVVAAPSYLERHGRPRHPDDLATHQCMVYTMRNSLPDWDLTHRSGQQVLIEHPSRLTANSGDALVNAAVSGAGLVLAPTFIIHHHLAAGRLERVLPDWQGMGGAIHAVYPPNRHLSAKVRVFIDYLIQRFGREVPYWDQGLDLVTR
ncbi:MAG: substrate binding domain-containing protein, partial [Rhodospirillaceae bacterium]